MRERRNVFWTWRATLLDDGGAEEALKVATPRKLESRNELFRHGGSANHVPPFENSDGEACACEVRGRREAVVAASDDQRVPFLVLQRAYGAGTAAAKAPPPHFVYLSLLAFTDFSVLIE